MDVTNPDIVIIGIFICVLILLGIIALATGLLGNNRKIIHDRLDRVKSRHGSGKNLSKEQAKKALFVKKENSLLDRLIPKPEEMRQRLDKTGKDITFKKYILATLLVSVIGVVITRVFVFSTLPPAMALGIFLGLYIPHAFINFTISRRLKKFTAQFPEAIDLIVRGLRAGLPITESIYAVAREMQDPISTEFGKITDEIKLGMTMDESLWATAKRLDTPDFKFFVISLSVQQETGGNLTETLVNLSEILRARSRLKLKIRAMVSEGKASAYIIGSLPFLMLALLSVMNYEYVSVLFTNPKGQIALIGAGIWLSIGGGILAKMINFEV